MLLVASLLLVGIATAKAQLPVNTGDKSVEVKVYAGILSGINISDQALNYDAWSNLRLGAIANWSPSSWATFKTYTTYDRYQGDGTSINSFSLRLHGKRTWLEFGKMATPSTELRPLPPYRKRPI